MTNRECEVLNFLFRGWTDAQIGGRLGVSARTVSGHVFNLLERFSVRTRGAAVYKALEMGLLTPPAVIEVIEPGRVNCRYCGGDLVEDAGCAMCGEAETPEGVGEENG